MFWTVLFIFVVVCFLLDQIIRSLKVGGYTHKYVFVTGCDSGFGHDLVLNLDKLGFNVFAGCLTDKGQAELRTKASSRLLPIPLDVSQSHSIQNALECVKQKLPDNTGLWAVVNNAGITGAVGVVEMCKQEDFQKVTAINLFGPIEVCRLFLPLVRKAKGRVVNMTSAMGRIVSEAPPYAVSKFGMEAFSDCLRRDLYSHDVKVSIIEPGFFKTHVTSKESMDDVLVKSFKDLDEEVKQAYGGDKFVKKRINAFRFTRQLASDDLSLVVKAYTHAVTSQFPRTRYVVGWDAKLVYIPLSMAPAELVDWLSAKVMGKWVRCLNGRAGVKKSDFKP